MLRFMIFALFFLGFCQAYESFDTKLLKVDDIYGFINDDDRLIIGSGGIVIAKFDTSKSIIARAKVIEKKDNLAKLEFSVFEDLEQKALPLPDVLPQTGDLVRMNFLYNRALIIAPNEQIYNEIESKFKNTSFTHIDIFGAYLIKNSILSPKRSDFRQICAQNALGVVMFALNEKGVVVDCHSFDILEEFALPKTQNLQTPFYSRVGGYEAKFFDFNAAPINNYYRYYDTLINIYKR